MICSRVELAREFGTGEDEGSTAVEGRCYVERDTIKKVGVLHRGICYRACSNGLRFAVVVMW